MTGKKRYLTAEDVARIFTEERQAKALPGITVPSVKAATVRRYVRFSRPAPPGSKPNRYQENPIPLPDYVPAELVFSPGTGGAKQIKTAMPIKMMVWKPSDEKPLRKWYSEDRKGQGAGGGRPW